MQQEDVSRTQDRIVPRLEEDTWKGRTVLDPSGKRWPDIDDSLNWEPIPGKHSGTFAVAMAHPYEQMAEQIMYAKGLKSLQAAVETALQSTFESLTDEETSAGLQGMVQAGEDSGVYDGDPFEEIFADLRRERAVATDHRKQAA